MNKPKSKITLYETEGTIIIDFYLTNNMPCLILVDEDDNLLQDLTTNIWSYVDGTIGIRSDEEAIAEALVDAGWIKSKPETKLPSGFIYIHYYPLTKKALEQITKVAEELDIQYPEQEW